MASPATASAGALLAIAANPVATIPEVITSFTALDAALPASDGLKWFNGLYLQVTQAVDLTVGTATWNNPAWLARLDVVFAGLYLNALVQWLTPGQSAPRCWQVLFNARNDARLARIQFALAGMNAHIDRDLSVAVVQVCREFSLAPVHLSPQYLDYCHVNDLLDGLIDTAKKELLTGLLGDDLPGENLVENMAAAWGLRATRETAWTKAELLWHAQSIPGLEDRFLCAIDVTADLTGRGLLAPVGV